jgi:hypothetical protein
VVYTRDNAPLHHIVIQHCILIFLGLILVLISLDGCLLFSVPPLVASGPNKPYKKPGLAYRPGQAEGVGLDW